MDPHLVRAFQRQIWTQCRFAQIAYEELNNRVASMAQDQVLSSQLYSQLARNVSREESRAQAAALAMEVPLQAWAPIQALLTAVANISKALWGQTGKYTAERALLRQSLSVREDSVLKPTSMRNNFDHFDERIDRWWENSTRHNSIDLAFGDMGNDISGLEVDEMFRSYDPASGNLAFWGKQYHLPTIMSAVDQLASISLRSFVM
jgi:hypothetical protein